MKNALIIFVRNPVSGKVKTRLAASVGNEKALLVYNYLLNHTKSITEKLPATVFVYYADYLNENDLWNGCEKRLQSGTDLGERMKIAFEQLFNDGFTNVCIIGSDCYELTTEIINEAFKKLQNHKTVIGPAKDGGYYLLGMKYPLLDLFRNIEWSTNTVFIETLNKIKFQQLTMHLLPELNDIDEKADLFNSGLAGLLK
jgi:uncharacterized protein